MYQKNGICILIPTEYETLRDSMKVRHRILSDVLLFTGMRYSEAVKFALNKHWYDREKKYIYLPREADRKRKRVTPDRYIYLTLLGRKAVDRLFEDNIKFSSYQAFDNVLKMAVKKSKLEMPKDSTLSIKTFRKTLECWLTVTYSDKIPLISMCQGHTEMIALKHYLNIPFSDDEKNKIKEYVGGWI